MENFFAGETFCTDLEGLMYLLDIGEDVDVPDDWTYKIEEAILEPMFHLSVDKVSELLYDHYSERYSEDAPEYAKVIKALNECVDFEKFNSMMPKLWYPNGNFITVTKKDLLDFV